MRGYGLWMAALAAVILAACGGGDDTTTTAPEDERMAVKTARDAATTFSATDVCPITFGSASFVGTISSAERTDQISSIVGEAALAEADGGGCAGLTPVSSALPAPELESYVRERVEVGHSVVALNWNNADGSPSATTLVVTDNQGEVVFSPVMHLTGIPGPPPPSPNDASTSASVKAQQNQSTTVSWTPWEGQSENGNADYILAESAIEKVPGVDDGPNWVEKNPQMSATFSDGQVQDMSASGGTSVSGPYQAKVEIATAVVEDGHCKKFKFQYAYGHSTKEIEISEENGSFEVNFSGVGQASSDLQIYKICQDGSKKVVQ